jgi:gas vesicle structural protein
MAVATQGTSGNYLQRGPSPSGLADVLNVILDKGLVVDVYVRVSLVGIELLTVDARIVVASVDTYLRFAEAVNRLDLREVGEGKTLPEFFESANEDGAKSRTKGVLEGAKEKIFGEDNDDADGNGGRSRSATSGSRSRSSSASRSRAKRS